jgi:hypothetical protein
VNDYNRRHRAALLGNGAVGCLQLFADRSSPFCQPRSETSCLLHSRRQTSLQLDERSGCAGLAFGSGGSGYAAEVPVLSEWRCGSSPFLRGAAGRCADVFCRAGQPPGRTRANRSPLSHVIQPFPAKTRPSRPLLLAACFQAFRGEVCCEDIDCCRHSREDSVCAGDD